MPWPRPEPSSTPSTGWQHRSTRPATRFPGLLQDTEADLSAARQAAAAAQAESGVVTRVAEAERLLAAAKTAAAAAAPDVLTAQTAATQANTAANEALAGIRAAADQRTREKATLDAQMRSASSAVDRAADYIETRRGGVGQQARTRLAEAQRHWEAARAAYAADPARSLQEAREAERLAGTAYGIAQGDFDQYDRAALAVVVAGVARTSPARSSAR